MATVRKGNGTTVRRRSKSAAKEAATAQESNGMPARNGAAAARLDRERTSKPYACAPTSFSSRAALLTATT